MGHFKSLLVKALPVLVFLTVITWPIEVHADYDGYSWPWEEYAKDSYYAGTPKDAPAGTLFNGEYFNGALRDLVGEYSEAENQTIKEIVFENVGIGMPTGFDKKIPVGKNVYAYYNSAYKRVTIYTPENHVYFNENCNTMFRNMESLESISFGNKIDTSKVVDMGSMFSGCNSLKSLLQLQSFNTANVNNMACMFFLCENLKSIDLSSFNTSNTISMGSMFSDCSALESLNLGSFRTNEVTSMRSMFRGCNSLTTLDLHGFDTSKVTDMSCMFSGCYNLTSLNISNFNTSKVENMEWMFSGTRKLSILDVASFRTGEVTNMAKMFYGCGATDLDVYNFNTSKVEDFNWMFAACRNLTSIDISNFYIKDGCNLEYMFYDNMSNTSIKMPSKRVCSPGSMASMFDTCKSLTQLDLSSFKVKSGCSVDRMLVVCENLATVDAPQKMEKDIPFCENKEYAFDDNKDKKADSADKYTSMKKSDTGHRYILLGHVDEPVATTKAVTGVSLNKKSAYIVKGKTLTLKVTVKPKSATNQKVTWKSSNKKVATVNDKGVIKAIKKGTATITVTTKDGKKTAKCKVTVMDPVKVRSIKFSKKSYSIKKGKTIVLKPIIDPTSATNKEVTYESSNKRIATVDKNGKVKGKKKGKVIITVTTNDGKKKAMCTINVK